MTINSREQRSIRNVAVLAHVDAGKTTLTEHMLYKSGAIRQLGDVDKGTTQSDTDEIERSRGISVQLSQVSFNWMGNRVNLIDTPGHVDFSAQVEYSLSAIDGAVVVVSAVEGVQAHTSSILRALDNLSVPILVFINKVDRVGADVEAVLNELQGELPTSFVPLQVVESEGNDDVVVNRFCVKEIREQFCMQWENTQELVAQLDESLLDEYFANNSLSWQTLSEGLGIATRQNRAIPVLYGSAKRDVGVGELMDAIVDLLPSPAGDSQKTLSGIVYKVEPDRVMGKMASVRIFEGVLKNRVPVYNASLKKEMKSTRITIVNQQQQVVCEQMSAGDIGQVAGFSDVRAGDIIGMEPIQRGSSQLDVPLLTVKVDPCDEKDYMPLAEALSVLDGENPLLNLKWLKGEKELHIDVMGKIQIEILETILLSRFGLKVNFSNPVVIYKETPICTGNGYERYTMPKPCWAVVGLVIEPTEPGSGVTFESKVSVNDIARKYQHEVERTITQSLSQGVKGWEVTDLKITLVEGEDHVMHSRPGDFCVATPMAIMKGLQNVGTKLLEPILNFKIIAPQDLLGVIASDLTRMRATFANPQFGNGTFILKGEVPLASSMEYHIKLYSRTGGKGKFMTSLSGYRECPPEQGVEREYKGINPLDRSKWILKARKALQD